VLSWNIAPCVNGDNLHTKLMLLWFCVDQRIRVEWEFWSRMRWGRLRLLLWNLLFFLDVVQLHAIAVLHAVRSAHDLGFHQVIIWRQLLPCSLHSALIDPYFKSFGVFLIFGFLLQGCVILILSAFVPVAIRQLLSEQKKLLNF